MEGRINERKRKMKTEKAKADGAEKKPEKKSAKTAKQKGPATEIMKTVAARATGEKNIEKLKKTFTPEEIEEIIIRRNSGEALSRAEHQAIGVEQRRIKRLVKELELGNRDKVILMPSIKSSTGFYKLFDFSALYFVYRLANRMGRSARLMRDNDKFSRMVHSASLVNVEKFAEQFEQFESPRLEITVDGIYIFTLKKPLTDEEVSELRMIEETRRESLYNTLRPKKANPAIFQGILMAVRQIGPKAKKLERHEYYAIGENMLINLKSLIRVYFDYSRGVMGKEQAGMRLIMLIDDLFAGLAVLSELRIWDYGVAAAIGDNINEVRRLVIKELGIKEG